MNSKTVMDFENLDGREVNEGNKDKSLYI